MSQARRVPPISLVLLLLGCGHGSAGPPAAPEPGPAAASLHAAAADRVDPAPASGGPTGAQTIIFGEDDVESEPTTQIRSAPKRPPIPSFELFGTRKGDGP